MHKASRVGQVVQIVHGPNKGHMAIVVTIKSRGVRVLFPHTDSYRTLCEDEYEVIGDAVLIPDV